MGLVRQVRDSDGGPLRNHYEKIATEGDLYRFQSSVDGLKEVVSSLNTGVVVGTDYITFPLGFSYTPGMKQIMVGILDTTTGDVLNLVDGDTFRSYNSLPSGGTAIAMTLPYYEESSITSVSVYNYSPGVEFWCVFYIPATAAPASQLNKVVVTDQSNDEAIEMKGNGDGIVFRTPSGYRRMLRIDDNGDVTTEPR